MPVKNKMREGGSRTEQGGASDQEAGLTKSLPTQQKAVAPEPAHLRNPHWA